MEAISRKPFQGIVNIIRFNWHFYLYAFAFLILLHIGKDLVSFSFHPFIGVFGLLLVASIITSLFVSYYVYDVSSLYKLDWLKIAVSSNANLVNIHAGFDETSNLIALKYPEAKLSVFDFYDPEKHTEVSIKRARKVYAPYPGTKAIETNAVPLPQHSIDVAFCFLSAHEIRNDEERILFFQHLQKSLKKDGKIVVVEHIRDMANFLAYNIGAFHFHSKNTWKKTFDAAGLSIENEQKITPFITAYTLTTNGTAS